MSEQVIIYYFCSLSFWLAHQQSVTIHSSSIAWIKQQFPPPLVCKLPRLGKEQYSLFRDCLFRDWMKTRYAATSLQIIQNILRQTFKSCTVSLELEDKPRAFRFIRLWLFWTGSSKELTLLWPRRVLQTPWRVSDCTQQNCRVHGALCLRILPFAKSSPVGVIVTNDQEPLPLTISEDSV